MDIATMTYQSVTLAVVGTIVSIIFESMARVVDNAFNTTIRTSILPPYKWTYQQFRKSLPAPLNPTTIVSTVTAITTATTTATSTAISIDTITATEPVPTLLIETERITSVQTLTVTAKALIPYHVSHQTTSLLQFWLQLLPQLLQVVGCIIFLVFTIGCGQAIIRYIHPRFPRWFRITKSKFVAVTKDSATQTDSPLENQSPKTIYATVETQTDNAPTFTACVLLRGEDSKSSFPLEPVAYDLEKIVNDCTLNCQDKSHAAKARLLLTALSDLVQTNCVLALALEDCSDKDHAFCINRARTLAEDGRKDYDEERFFAHVSADTQVPLGSNKVLKTLLKEIEDTRDMIVAQSIHHPSCTSANPSEILQPTVLKDVQPSATRSKRPSDSDTLMGMYKKIADEEDSMLILEEGGNFFYGPNCICQKSLMHRMAYEQLRRDVEQFFEKLIPSAQEMRTSLSAQQDRLMGKMQQLTKLQMRLLFIGNCFPECEKSNNEPGAGASPLKERTEEPPIPAPTTPGKPTHQILRAMGEGATLAPQERLGNDVESEISSTFEDEDGSDSLRLMAQQYTARLKQEEAARAEREAATRAEAARTEREEIARLERVKAAETKRQAAARDEAARIERENAAELKRQAAAREHAARIERERAESERQRQAAAQEQAARIEREEAERERQRQRDETEARRVAREQVLADQSETIRKVFARDFPNGHEIILTSGSSLECGFHAIINSMAAHPELPQPTLQELRGVLNSQEFIRHSAHFGVTYRANFTVDQIGAILHFWADLHDYNLQLGVFVEGRGPMLVATEASERGDRIVVWIHNDNAHELTLASGGNASQLLNHFSGLRQSGSNTPPAPASSREGQVKIPSEDEDGHSGNKDVSNSDKSTSKSNESVQQGTESKSKPATDEDTQDPNAKSGKKSRQSKAAKKRRRRPKKAIVGEAAGAAEEALPGDGPEPEVDEMDVGDEEPTTVVQDLPVGATEEMDGLSQSLTVALPTPQQYSSVPARPQDGMDGVERSETVKISASIQPSAPATNQQQFHTTPIAPQQAVVTTRDDGMDGVQGSVTVHVPLVQSDPSASMKQAPQPDVLFDPPPAMNSHSPFQDSLPTAFGLADNMGDFHPSSTTISLPEAQAPAPSPGSQQPPQKHSTPPAPRTPSPPPKPAVDQAIEMSSDSSLSSLGDTPPRPVSLRPKALAKRPSAIVKSAPPLRTKFDPSLFTTVGPNPFMPKASQISTLRKNSGPNMFAPLPGSTTMDDHVKQNMNMRQPGRFADYGVKAYENPDAVVDSDEEVEIDPRAGFGFDSLANTCADAATRVGKPTAKGGITLPEAKRSQGYQKEMASFADPDEEVQIAPGGGFTFDDLKATCQSAVSNYEKEVEEASTEEEVSEEE